MTDGTHSLKFSLRALVGPLLIMQALLLGWVGLRCSPGWDEVGHLAAGLYTWRFGRFDVYRVNPPLVRTVATLPLRLGTPGEEWRDYRSGLVDRPEWVLGAAFFAVNGQRGFWYLTYARWACIPFVLVGGYVCFRWASELYGDSAGLLALVLWCLCPNVIASGAMITADAAAAALGVAATYRFWSWLRCPTWKNAASAGLMLGLAELTKTSWVILFGIWPVTWVLWRRLRRTELGRVPWRRDAAQLALLLAVGCYTLNAGYLFDGTFRQLKDYTFASRTLVGGTAKAERMGGGNRFEGNWLGRVPVPFPADYIIGIDLQKLDFERPALSYLAGEWKRGGWWYYYLACAALKIPLGTWLLGLAALGLSVCDAVRRCRAAPCGGGVEGSALRSTNLSSNAGCNAPPAPRSDWRDEIVLLLPAACLFVLVSSQTGFNRYFRYVLPCLPFAYIWISKVAQVRTWRNWRTGIPIAAAVCWSGVSSLGVYPHALSYFNELAGGPAGGHRFLLSANIDWGQDLFYLKRWLEQHPEARPLRMSALSVLSPDHFGIQSHEPPPGPGAERHAPAAAHRLGPQPGWYAISVHMLHDNYREFEYFLHFRPVARAGYSIDIYHVTVDAANRVRAELGLPALSAVQRE